MLGYCGINCAECNAYKGTVATDISLLERAAKDFWDGAYSASEWVCLGCTPADQPFLAKYCASCKFRTCAIAKGVSNCAACPDFEGCTQLKEFIAGESEGLVQRMDWLRERFLALQSSDGLSQV